MKDGDRKFSNAYQVLEFWYEYANLVAEYGMPSLYIHEQEAIDNPPREWDYPDWWYEWVTIDKALSSLSKSDQYVILDYFKNIYPYSKKGNTSVMERWKFTRKWKGIQYRIMLLIPADMKHTGRKKWTKKNSK